MVTNTLVNRAFLVSLHAPVWTGAKTDKQASQQTLAANNATEDAGKFTKYLIPPDRVKPYYNAVMAARLDHYRLTSPWLAGQDILASQLQPEYSLIMQEHRITLDKLRREFLDWYDSYMRDQSQSMARLGNLYQAREFPRSDRIARRLQFSVTLIPFPDITDWRAVASLPDAAAIVAETEQRINDAVGNAQRANWQRLHQALVDLIGKLDRYDGTRKGAFRDSVMTELCDLAGLLPALNLTNDPLMDDLARQVHAQLCVHSPDTLRESADTRTDALAKARAMADSVSAIMGVIDDD